MVYSIMYHLEEVSCIYIVSTRGTFSIADPDSLVAVYLLYFVPSLIHISQAFHVTHLELKFRKIKYSKSHTEKSHYFSHFKNFIIKLLN